MVLQGEEGFVAHVLKNHPCCYGRMGQAGWGQEWRRGCLSAKARGESVLNLGNNRKDGRKRPNSEYSMEAKGTDVVVHWLLR